MPPDTGANQAGRQQLAQDTVVELWLLDYSKLLDDVGNPVHVKRYCSATREGDNTQDVIFDGNAYERIPIRAEGFKRTAGDKPVRPRVIIANGNGATEKFLNALVPQSSIRGSTITRMRIYGKHLDHGSEPDVYRIWEPIDRMVIDRLSSANRNLLTYELRSSPDVEGLKIPRRIIDNELCAWVYRGAHLDPLSKVSGCTWDGKDGPGPYFDLDDASSTAENDDCSRSLNGCAIRHNPGNKTLPFGGFVTVGTSVR